LRGGAEAPFLTVNLLNVAVGPGLELKGSAGAEAPNCNMLKLNVTM